MDLQSKITNPKSKIEWRRMRDSNSQGITPGGFQDRCLTN
jgi:hypothetical protein